MTSPRPIQGTPQAVMYLRVSTKEQAHRGGETEGFSIPAQREACLRKAELMGISVVDEFIDAGESARSADRPDLPTDAQVPRNSRDKVRAGSQG